MAVMVAGIALAAGSAVFLGWFFIALCRDGKRAGIGQVLLLHTGPARKKSSRESARPFVVPKNPQVTVNPTTELQSQQRLVSGERKR